MVDKEQSGLAKEIQDNIDEFVQENKKMLFGKQKAAQKR